MLPRTRTLVAGVAAVVALALPAAAGAADFPLVGWWPMNEGSGQVVRDWSGHGNNGMLGSSPGVDSQDPTWIPGVFAGSALRFDGNDVVQIPDDPSLNAQQLTVAAWFRGSASPGALRYVVAKGAQDCDRASYGLYSSSNGGMAFYISGAAGASSNWYRSPEAPASVWDGKWHHAAGTYAAPRCGCSSTAWRSAAARQRTLPSPTTRPRAPASSATTTGRRAASTATCS
jgi:hypothetical protein